MIWIRVLPLIWRAHYFQVPHNVSLVWECFMSADKSVLMGGFVHTGVFIKGFVPTNNEFVPESLRHVE